MHQHARLPVAWVRRQAAWTKPSTPAIKCSPHFQPPAATVRAAADWGRTPCHKPLAWRHGSGTTAVSHSAWCPHKCVRVHLKGKSRIHSLTIVVFLSRSGEICFFSCSLSISHKWNRSLLTVKKEVRIWPERNYINYQLSYVFIAWKSFVLCQILGHILLLPGKDAGIRIISC